MHTRTRRKDKLDLLVGKNRIIEAKANDVRAREYDDD